MLSVANKPLMLSVVMLSVIAVSVVALLTPFSWADVVATLGSMTT